MTHRLPPSPARRATLTGLTLVAAVFAAFWPALGNGFVDWDDDYLLLDHNAYRGFGWDQLGWMFTTTRGGHYQPLTWLSYAVDHALWGGVEPFGVHLTNLLLHAAVGLLFFFLARRLIATAQPEVDHRIIWWGACLAAVVFAVHPLRVESVAWASERRDVLSGVGLMGTLLLYLRAVEGGTRSRQRCWFGAIVCYVLSLLSKATGMTLPVVLVILDGFPLRRFPLVRPQPRPDEVKITDSAANLALKNTGRSVRTNPRSGFGSAGVRIMAEKLVFAIPALLSAVVALAAQSKSGALWAASDHPFGQRLMQSFHGISFYLWKSVYPVNLIPLYEQPTDASSLRGVNLFGAVVFVSVSVLVWFLRRRVPALLAAWLAYLVILAPVLGLAQSGPQLVADRYSYVSCMPWAVLVGGCWSRFLSRKRPNRVRDELVPSKVQSVRFIAGALLPIFPLIVLIPMTRAQTRIWSDTRRLWTEVLNVAPRTGMAHANLAAWYNDHDDVDAACRHAREALDILPGHRVAHIALARCSEQSHDLPVALRHYAIALGIRPDDPQTLVRYAATLHRSGRTKDAVVVGQRLVELQPDVAEHYHFLAGLLGAAGDTDQARDQFERALDLDPALTDAAVRLSRLETATGNYATAIQVLRSAVARNPEVPDVNAALAWLWATAPDPAVRDGPSALRHARIAMKRADEIFPRAQEALAAALAETGAMDDALATVSTLLRDPPAPWPPFIRERLERQRSAYVQRRPYRDSP